MKRIRIIGLSLVAVFAMSAVVAASASAESLPRYANCEKAKKIGKAYTGAYTEKYCEKVASPKGTGEYELTPWREGETSKVTSKSAKSTLDFANEKGEIVQKVECAKDKGTGEITGEETDTEVITFEKCILNGNKKELCGTAGTIKTELFSELALLSGGKAGMGLEGSSGGVFAVFNCGPVYFEVRGREVGNELKPENSCSKTITSTFAVNSKGEEESEVGSTLRAFVYNEKTGKEEELNKGGLQSTETQKGETFCVWTETEAERLAKV
jgi:hypothetical protein